ncbi:MAG: valyl-tRNA synthetase [Parcubacteria group bacterium Athens1014_10]|nr:MAG: valyl-tRNA synthetase [Parcubacteria group bacterium Athens1014_10]TSD05121.1 MAG: valyl-tRNA synthetase [Parcubacteria group bacterium Athens0714_12]
MSSELEKTYQPNLTEEKIYRLWEKSGYFNPENLPAKKNKKSFTIAIPPPNITGSLHMGHALNAIIQDTLIRYKRMRGFKTLWIPGTDHAGIATQNVVEKQLKKEGLTRFDLGKEKFIEKVWQWKKEYGDIILNQFKKLGCSCDWSKTRFTMDKDYAKAVEIAFKYYYKKGWIYEGERVVNWCPRCRTSLSDLELNYKEEKGKLWHIKYLLKSSPNKCVIVATTRPETMLGDTAVAVNPKDKRYKDLVGEKLILPILNKEIPIIADRAVDLNFGTGAVKVTPSHDPADWEIGQRHNLEAPKIIGQDGLMTDESKICSGMTPLQCRAKVLEELEKQGLLEKTEEYTHSRPYCYRCSSLIEPMPSHQWFLKMDELAKKAIKAVKSGEIKFIPKRFEKSYFDWLNNIKDWCISRQIWWGHKIPLEGVDDVLDTWFSSALWPFATLGWPEKTELLKEYYPTTVLSTARDIINLWVARMIFSSLEFTKKIPFKEVFVHPTVLNIDGKRMSKSLGTGVDPLELIGKYGADAVRFGLAWQITGNQDIHFIEDNIVMGKKFCNKIWNASRFVMFNLGMESKNFPELKLKKFKNLSKEDKLILKKLESAIKKVSENLEKYRFSQSAEIIYDFFWHEFCDKYIEIAKNQLKNEKQKLSTQYLLWHILSNSLKLLHPFIPFITEEIWQKLPHEDGMLIVASWPK